MGMLWKSMCDCIWLVKELPFYLLVQRAKSLCTVSPKVERSLHFETTDVQNEVALHIRLRVFGS